jgi:Na+/H+ antiporter NhaD/arsenite permease-like protein
MLIGETLHLPFGVYTLEAITPVLAGLGLTWGLIVWQVARVGEPWTVAREAGDASAAEPLDRWQTAKGMAVAGVLLLAFLFAPWPREVVALTGVGVLLMSRKFHSSKMLGLVDWELLVMFIGLFSVNHALQKHGLQAQAVAEAAALGVALGEPMPLFGASFVLSNIVSNVPAVMLLLPAATHTLAVTAG